MRIKAVFHFVPCGHQQPKQQSPLYGFYNPNNGWKRQEKIQPRGVVIRKVIGIIIIKDEGEYSWHEEDKKWKNW